MMREENGNQAENLVLFCTRPWRVMGAAVSALVGITIIWGIVVLATYPNDERFGNDNTLSVTEFLSRNVAMPGSISLPDTIAPAVVSIDGGKVNGGMVASGALVGANGYVLTTLHSIEGLPEISIRVRTKGGLQGLPAQLVKKAPSHDLVLLKIQSPGSFLYLSLADTSGGLGGTVYAFGDGANGSLVVRQGGIDARPVTLSVGTQQISHLRRTDAVYSWEQNGGPIVNADGAVVGITIAINDGNGAVHGYAVPAAVIASHFRDVLDFKIVGPTPPVDMIPTAQTPSGRVSIY